MSNCPSSNRVLTEGPFDVEAATGSSSLSTTALTETARYYFNLTDGNTIIRDEDGVEASSIQAAAIFAMEAVEELRAQDPSSSDEWRGWRLEIVDASGQAIQMIPLDALSAH